MSVKGLWARQKTLSWVSWDWVEEVVVTIARTAKIARSSSQVKLGVGLFGRGFGSRIGNIGLESVLERPRSPAKLKQSLTLLL